MAMGVTFDSGGLAKIAAKRRTRVKMANINNAPEGRNAQIFY
jgi:hypothetical protein